MTRQSKEIGFNPKFFYAAVGTAFPVYRDKMGPMAEGVMGLGTWNPKMSPRAKAYFDAHVASWKKEPDRWASAHAWAGLEILQQAVEKVGLDRKAMRDYVASAHDTIIGKIRFRNGENISTPGVVSQWSAGEFEVVWPPSWRPALRCSPSPPGSNLAVPGKTAPRPGAPRTRGVLCCGPFCPSMTFWIELLAPASSPGASTRSSRSA